MNPVNYLAHDRLAIYLFHGVIERDNYEVRNYTRKHLRRERFYEIVQTLVANGRALSMPQVAEYAAAKTPWPSRAFAITFDDGFENNISVAAPILEHFGVPATFYVTTRFIDENAMSWIDKIEYCIERVRRGALQLPWAAEPKSFASTAEKIALLDEIRRVVKRDPAIDPEALARDVAGQCNMPCPEQSNDPLDLKMSWEHVGSLHESPLFTIGGHTHTHAVMSFLSDDKLETEIETSLKLLRDRAGCDTTHYSYPEGMRHCYSQSVIQALKRHGIVCCPTAEPGTNAHAEDLFRLRRIAVT